MSPSTIVQIAKNRAPVTFAGLTIETVRGWIDRTGDRPRWSDAVLRRAEQGNVVGHSKGGQRGILVSSSCIVIQKLLLTLMLRRPFILKWLMWSRNDS